MTNIEIPKNGKLLTKPQSTYYGNITRTSDLLIKSDGLSFSGNSLVKPNYYIAPSSVKYDTLVMDILYELDQKLQKPLPLPSPETVLTSSISEILANALNNGNGSSSGDTFQNYLQRSGYSGTLIKVASQINASRIDAFIRTVLSKTGIFFYLAFRTIEGNGIKDVSGIVSNMMDAVGIVKSYINTNLVDKVIQSQNLSATVAERTKIKNHFINREIAYSPGKPAEIIEEFFVSLKKGGSIFEWVRNFVYSDKVNLPRNTNKDELVQKMVNYLLSIGYVYQGGTNDSGFNSGDGSLGSGMVTPDDFSKAIEGVGPATEKRFIDAGIYRFVHLAELDNDRLKLIIKDKGTTDYTDIIEQAKLIAAGKFEELIAFQKKLNKK